MAHQNRSFDKSISLLFLFVLLASALFSMNNGFCVAESSGKARVINVSGQITLSLMIGAFAVVMAVTAVALAIRRRRSENEI